MKVRNLLFFLTLLLIVSCSTNQNSGNNQTEMSQGIYVKTRVVQQPDPTNVLCYSGVIMPEVSVPLSFERAGTVIKIYADEGDPVQKGQLLAEIDPTTYESTYQAAKSMQAQAQDAYDRLKLVYEKGSLPEIKWEEIKSKLEQANASMAIAEQNLKKCKIVAPMDGFIGSRSVEVGSSAFPGVKVLDVVSIHQVYVKISVPENEINMIQKKQQAEVIVGAVGNASYSATVEKIGVVANSITKTYTIKLIVSNPDLQIKPGMVCDVNLIIPVDNQFPTVPVQALSQDQTGNKYVFIVDENEGKAVKKNVVVGKLINNEVEIVTGLSSGDRIIVEGYHKIKDQDQIAYE